jgi:Ran GTPase-activating protein (RanGAP) involved in mRNA processing and transport
MLDERQARANQKGVSLFTSGSDQPFVIDKFAAAFEEQILAERFIYASLGWTDRDMEPLVEVLLHCRNLKNLDLFQNKIAHTGAEKLAEVLPSLVNLVNLKLQGCYISDAGATSLVKAVPSLVNLDFLDLSENNISDAGTECLAKALPSLVKLSSLRLAENNISDAGAKSLAKALPSLTNLSTLDLENNDISDAGATSLAEALSASSMQDRPYLTINCFTGNNIGETAAQELKAAMDKQNREIMVC